MPGPELLPDILRRRAATEPAATAYVFLDDHGAEAAALTWAGLDQRARVLAARLARIAAPGERALLAFPPGLDFVAAFFACLYAGVAAVPVIPPRRGRAHRALAGIVADCAPVAALTTTALSGTLPGAAETIAVDAVPAHGEPLEPRPCAPEGIAFLQYTSGSTGAPKGVVVTHGNLIANQEMIRRAFGHDRHSTFVAWAPLYHDQGLIGNVLQPLYLGSASVLMAPVTFIRRPLLWLTAISRYRAHTSGGPDFAFDACVAHAARAGIPELDLSCWRVAFDGAEPIRPGTLRRFADTFAPSGFDPRALYPCYGLAEATLLVSGSGKGRGPREFRAAAAALEEGRLVPAPPAIPAHPAPAAPSAPAALSASTALSASATPSAPATPSARVAPEPAVSEPPTARPEVRVLAGSGTAAPGVTLAIVDPATGRPCPPDRIGEIWVAGANVAAGYWRNPDATAATFGARLPGDARRFLRTGDLGQLVAGELYVTGRIKDLIIVRGRNHHPHDLEHTAQAAHPAARAGGGAAFAAGDGVVLVQEIERGHAPSPAAAAEIAAALRAALVREHDLAPELVLTPAGALPRTSSGKIMRSAAREHHLGAGFERWSPLPEPAAR